jgi:hypothetical protein
MNTKTIASLTSLCPILAIAFLSAGCAGVPSTPQGAAAPSGASALNGTAYQVTLSFPGEAPVNDTLRFEHGRFESTACTAVGFPQWSDYTTTAEAGSIAFAVLAKNADGTTLDWRGTVHGDVLDATATRTMSGKTATGSAHGTRL